MNNDLLLTLGNPPGMILDLSDVYYVKTFAEKTETTLIQEVDSILKDKEHIHLALSGGLDSQFSLQLCIKLNKKITAYTYRSIWDGIYLNTDDVYVSELLCKKYNIKHHIIDIDLTNFFKGNLHYNYGHQYFNSSPQLAVHFYFLELLKNQFNIDHILLGGDPPIMQYNAEFKNNRIRMEGEHFFQDVMAPYYLFCKNIGVECFRDIYFHSPKALYCGYKNNLDVVEKNKIHYEKLQRPIPEKDYKHNKYIFKYAYYKNLVENLIPQISETTGFEKLKKILAMETGVYNMFDLTYRRPMISKNINSIKNKVNNQKIVNTVKVSSSSPRNIIHDALINDLYYNFSQLVIKTDSKAINQYSFDF